MDWVLESANGADSAGVYDLLVESFFFQEPVTSGLFRRHGPLQAEHCLGIHALLQPSSFKAVSRAKGRIVGAALNLNWETMPPWSPPDGEPFDKLFRFFSFVEENSNGGEEGWLNLQILTVHQDWRRKGIAEKLVQATEEEAVQKQYRGCRVVCTSAFTASLVEKRGWKQIYKLPYSEYEDPVFITDPPHLAVTVYVKRNPQYEEMKNN